MDKEVIGTLYDVAIELAKGKSEDSLQALQEGILLLEVAIDNAVAAGEPTAQLEEYLLMLHNIEEEILCPKQNA